MKITLLLLCCLVITVNCQSYTCSYENNNIISVIKDQYVESKLTCNFVIGSISVSPRLPTGLEINTEIGLDDTGKISGTPAYALDQTSYTVSVVRRGTTTAIKVVVKIGVIAPLTSCSYGIKVMPFMINYPNYVIAPTCDSATSSFTATGLPSGIEVDATSGAIRGTASTASASSSEQEASIVVNGISGGGQITVRFRYTIIEPSSPSASQGIIARFAADQAAWSASVYPTMMTKFDDGSIDYYTNVFDKTFYDCKSSDCIVVGGRVNKLYGRWSASLYFEEAGDYIFYYKSDDNCAIYIDDMITNKGDPTIDYNNKKTYTISISSPGYHAFSILHYNGDGASNLDVQWKVPSKAAVAYIPKESLRYVPSPMTVMTYPSKSYSLTIGNIFATNGIYIGYCPSIQVSPDLSNIGLSVLTTGRLTATAVKEYNNGAYTQFTFTCKSTYSGYDDKSLVVSFRTITISKDYAIQGLLGKYYKTSGRGNSCGFVDISSTYHTLVIQKVTTSDSDIWHSYSNEIWDGLSSDFANDYDIRWEGYIYVETEGNYTFSFSVEDGGRLYVTKTTSFITLDKGCEHQQNDFSWKLKTGLNYFSVRYIKGHLSPYKSLEVQYTGPGVSKKLIPNTALYHMPSLAFEYEYLRNDYVSGVEMSPNCPILVKVDEGKYSYYSISPSLPSGIEINPSTGCITGTPSVEIGNFSLTSFTIQACKSQGSSECLESSVSIEAHVFQPPTGLNYPSGISGEIGMAVELKPTYVSNTAVTWSSSPSLPKGLSFDPDGTIRGNPVEAFDDTVIVSCSNPSGSSEHKLSISIRACSNGNFVSLKYITGDVNLTISLYQTTSSGVGSVLYSKQPKDHTFNTYYSFFVCSSVSDLKLETNFEGQLGGTYVVSGENDVIFRKGNWDYDNPSAAIQFSIEKGDTPEISYRLSEYTYVIGEAISVYTNPIKYGASSFSVAENSLPLGVLFNTTTGEFYGYALAGAESKKVIVTAYGRDRSSSSTTSINFKFNDYCTDGYLLLTLEGIVLKNGEVDKMKLTGPSGVILNYEQGFTSYSTYRYSQCLPAGTYSFQYTGGTARWSIYKNNVLAAYYKETSYKPTYNIDLFTYIDVATEWEYSYKEESNWHSQTGGGWSKCTTAMLPTTSQTTTYYRAKFSLAYVDYAAISRFELSLSYQTGIVVYLNGKQLYIRNLGSSASDTSFSSSTKANAKFGGTQTRIVYGSNQRLNQGDNYIGIEIHKFESNSLANSFAATLSLSTDSVNSCQNVIPAPTDDTKGNYFNDKQAYDSYNSNNGFSKSLDSDINTKYVQSYSSNIIIRYWVVSGAAYTVDQYTFASADDYPCKDPYKWRLEGAREFSTIKDENINPFWEVIGSKDNGFGYEGTITGAANELPATRKKYYYFPVTTTKTYGYEAFRFTIYSQASTAGSCPTEVQYAEFNPLICRVASCPVDGSWPVTVAGNEASIECDSGYDGFKTRKCDSSGTWESTIDTSGCIKQPDATQLNYDFINPVSAYIGSNIKYTPSPNGVVTGYSISPKLPSGMSIDGVTGVIKGAPTEKVTSQIYAITATTTTNPVSQTLILTISQPYCRSETIDGIIYPETPAGSTIKIRCGSDYSGSASVTCSLVSGSAGWTSPDKSKCLPYPPPGCSDITDMTFKVNDPVNKIVTCKNPIVTYTINPSLPTGISLNVAGTMISLTGTASVALSPTTYLLNVTTAQGGYDELSFPLKIYEQIKSCSYAFGNTVMQVSQNIETEIYAPTCVGVVDSYVILNEASLPAGLKFDTTTGSIYGIATTLSSMPVSIIMNAVNPAGNSPQYTLLLQVVEAVIGSGNLLGEVTDDSTFGNTPGISDLMRRWEAGEYKTTLIDIPTGFANLEGSNIKGTNEYPITFPVRDSSSSVLRTNNYAARFTGYLNIPEAGNWQFSLKADDNIWMFIDDMTPGSEMTATYTNALTYAKTLGNGYRKIAIYFYNIGGQQNLYIKWKNANAGITDFTTIPDSAWGKPTGSILQKVTYPTYDYIFVKGIKIDDVIPTLVGPVTTWKIEPDIPPGVIFNNGIISGTPTIAYNRREYTITATNVVTVTVKLYFGILDNNGNSLSRGVTGYYYSGSVTCKVIQLSDVRSKLSLKFKRYETGGIQFPSSASVWDGLTNDFKNSFVTYWVGYLNFPEKGLYNFSYTATDWTRLYIGSENDYYSCGGGDTCGTCTKSIEKVFDGGLTYFGVLYGKAQDSANKSFTVKWKHDSGNYPFDMKDVDFEYLLHLPEGYLEYTYKIATYVSGITIKSNEPIFFQAQAAKYNSFAVNPLLPGGIVINPSTGVISGTPTDIGVLETTYTITASSTSDSSVPTYTTQVTFTVEQRFVPSNLVYPTISTNIGQKLRVNGVEVNSVSPSLDNAIGVVYTLKSELPTGLSLNPSTGEISGIPYQEWNTPVTIEASNPSGSTEAQVSLTVTGCPGIMKFLLFEYTLQNAQVTVQLMNSKGIILHTGSGLVGFKEYTYSDCNTPDTYNVTFERKAAASGGWFRLSLDNLVIYSANNTDGTYITDEYVVNGNLQTAPPVLTYPNPVVNVIPGEVVSLCPSIQNGASKVEIETSGDFPEFLRFSEQTGCVVGTTMGIISGGISITVKATNPSGTSSPVTLQIIPDQKCSGNKELAVFRFTCNNECPNIRYHFKSYSSSSYTIYNEGNIMNHDKWMAYCVTLGAYKLLVGNSKSHAWTVDTNFYIYLGTQLLDTYRHDSTTTQNTEYVVSLTSYLTESSEWYFSNVGPSNDKWKSELDTSYMTSKYRAGLFPTRTSIASYYGIEFNFYDSFEFISSLDLSITHDSGIVIYLNGQEIYRNGLPIGLLTSSTWGKRLVDTIAARSVVVPQQLIKNGKNYIAVECHKHRNSKAYDPFKASILPTASSTVQTGTCVLRTTMSGVKAVAYGVTSAGEEAVKAIDNNHGTKTYVQHDLSDYPVNFDIYWPNKRAEYFNMYDFWTANDRWEYRNPTGWRIYGSSEFGTNDWELIDTQASVNLPTTSAAQTQFKLNNIYKSYNAFRMQITGVRGAESGKYNYQVADILQYNCRPAYCSESEDGKWPSTAAGYTARIACDSTQSGWISRKCTANLDGTTADWENEIAGCQNHATSVSYAPTTFKVGFASELRPTTNGGVNSYYISCTNGLPTGITFEAETGILSGIVMIEDDSEAKTYECSVTATTGDGKEIKAPISISVTIVYCLSDETWPQTKAGETASIECISGYTGYRTRTCSSQFESSWEQEDISQCKKLPPEFTVSLNGFVNTEFTVQSGSTNQFTATVISGRKVTNWAVSESESRCSITQGGVLTYKSTAIDVYNVTLTASNSDSSFSMVIPIKTFANTGTIIYGTTQFSVFKDIEVDCGISFASGVTVTGAVNSIVLTPPDYTISPVTGCFKGVPKALGTTSYSVSINGGGATSISMTVTQATCSVPGSSTTVNAGEYHNATCALPQIGTISQYCPLKYYPVLEASTGRCEDPNPTSFAYPGNGFVTAYTNVPITNVAPIIVGSISSIKFSVQSGSLPPGVELEEDGSIGGAPAASGTYSGITIRAFGNQEKTATLTFTVTTPRCPAIPSRNLPEGEAGSEQQKACPEGYNGYVIIKCPFTANPSWSDEDSSGCTTPAPEVWGYETKDGYVTFSLGFYKSLKPKRTSGGMPTSFKVMEGILPEGISLRPSTGEITGMGSSEFSPSQITVMGINNVGQSSTKFEIRVVIAECPEDGEWPKRRAGSQAVLPCIDPSKVGQRSRQCPNVEDPRWESPVDTCKDAPPSFQYSSKDVNVYWDVPFSVSPMDVQGAPDSYRLSDKSPALPLGLSLDETTGTISGKVSTSVPRDSNVYQVIAHNKQGDSSPQLIILNVETFQCNGEGVWITTDYGSEAAILCPTGFIGTEVRPCNGYTVTGSTPIGKWGTPTNSSCVAIEDKTIPPAEKVYLKFEMSIPLKLKSDISGLHYQIFQQLVAKSLNTALNNTGVTVKYSSVLLDFIDDKTDEGESNLKVEVRVADAEANAKKLSSAFNPNTQAVMEEFNRLVGEGYTDLFGSTFISIDTSGEIEGPTAEASGDASTGTNVGMIIGLAVAGAAVLIIVAGCLYCRCISKSVERKKRPTGKKKAAAKGGDEKAVKDDGKKETKKDGVRV